MTQRTYPIIILTASCVAALLLGAGCEETTTVQGITLEPSSATVTDANGSVVFTAVQPTNRVYIAPLEWSVSDPTRGSVSASGGATGVYKRNGNTSGSNAVIVRDQTGAEGVAAVNQP